MSRLPARPDRDVSMERFVRGSRPACRAAFATALALALVAAAPARGDSAIRFHDAWAGGAPAATTAPNVVSVFAAGASPFHGLSGAVDAELAAADPPVRVVAVNVSASGVARGGAPAARPVLEAWDADGTYLGAAPFRGPLPAGPFVTPFQTLVLDVRCRAAGCRPARIARIRLAAPSAGPLAPPIYAIFDDLRLDPAAACGDDLDSDGDGLADYPDDPGCSGPDDLLERSAALACDDGVDNDGDGRADFDPVTHADPRAGAGDRDCASPTGASESPALEASVPGRVRTPLASFGAGVGASLVVALAVLLAVARPLARALR